MKKIYYYLMMMVAVFSLASCAHDDDSPVLNKVTPGQLTLDAGSIDGDNSKYTFTWTNAQFFVNGDLQRPVSLVGYEKSGVEYILMGVETGRDWSEAVSFGSKVSTSHITLDYEAIAKIMQENFGMVRSLDEEFESSIDFKLVAQYASPEDAVVESNILTVPFTLTVQPPYEGDKAKLFISIDTDWSENYVYAYADGMGHDNFFGPWGGYKIEGTTVTGPDGNQYYEVPLNDNFYKATINLIIHDVNDPLETRRALISITFADEDEDVYLRVVGDATDGYEVGRIEKPLPKLYVQSKLPPAEWPAYAMYVWKDGDPVEAGWPGIQPSGTEMINGEEWLVFEPTKPYTQNGTNWIINNNNGGKQFDLMTGFNFNKTTFVRVASNGSYSVSGGPIVSDGYVVYADDQTGYSEFALYQWGDENNLGGEWPGKTPDGTVAIDGITYKYFNYGDEVKGLTQNLIFNNNLRGEDPDHKQLPDFSFTFTRDLFLTVTSTGVTEK